VYYGTYTVVCDKPDWIFKPARYSYIPINTDKQNQDFVATLVRYYSKGYINDIFGTGVSSVTVTLSGAASLMCMTDTNGYYEFLNLLPRSYVVTPSKQNWAFLPLNKPYPVLTSNNDNQNFTGMQTVDVYSIEGYVRNSAGYPINNVTLLLTGNYIIGSVTYNTNGNGYYKMVGLPAGTYTVTPVKQGNSFNPQSRAWPYPYLLLQNEYNQDFVMMAGEISQNSFKPINNLFNPLTGGKTTVWYNIVQPGYVRVRIYTLDGRLVKTVVNEMKESGTYTVEWAGNDESNDVVSRGVYVIYFEGPGFKDSKKIIVTK
jgi:hypothetical protein